jgi:uncharacterized protein (TIGR02453 family)
MASAWFTKDLFTFLTELGEENNREWFQANRDRWERDVRDPMLAFILAFGEPLSRISRHFVADPRAVGGSMFRIFRDTRFSRDKTPYKTNVGAQFRHGACTRDVHAPGFYLHLEPSGCFASAGMWHPDAGSLHKVRERILSHPKEWKALADLEVQGDRLVRVPAGFPADNPLADDLKLKDFYTWIPVARRQVCSGDFLETYAEICRRNVPLVKFLSKALDLPF